MSSSAKNPERSKPVESLPPKNPSKVSGKSVPE